MSGILDTHSIEIPCKNCGNKTVKTFGWIKANSEFVCSCGTKIHLEADQFKREIAKVDASLDKLKRTIASINKRK